MTALTADRNTPRRNGIDFVDPVAASAIIYAGALVALNGTGYLVPGSAATGLKARGIAQENIDNSTGIDGALRVPVMTGVFRFANDGTITIADIEATAYIVDDQTVADNDGTGTRSVAGTIKSVDSAGVWVNIG